MNRINDIIFSQIGINFYNMNDQYFNFNFPTQSVGTIMNCENINCTKVINNTIRSSIPLSMCSCCYKLYCYSCFQTPTHQCENKNIINNSDPIEYIPCSRCKIKQSTHNCVSCNSQYFCQECCRIVHSIKKFSYHPVTLLGLNKKQQSTTNSIQKQTDQHKIKQTIIKPHHHYHKKSPSYVQLESLNLNPNFQQFYQYQQQQLSTNNNLVHENIENIQTVSKKVQLSQSMISLKKSQIKLAQLSIKQKWQKISNSIQSTFKMIQQKIRQKHLAMRKYIQQQIQKNLKQINLVNDQLKQLQLQMNNVKLLLVEKNKKSKFNTTNNNNNSDFVMVKFINEKFMNCETKIDVIKSSNNNILVDTKLFVSKQFTDMFKRIQEQIDSLTLQSIIKHNNNNNDQQKSLVRNFDQISFHSNNVRDRKKPLMINTSTKYHKKTQHNNNTLTTTKKYMNNISFSHQLNNSYLVNAKQKKRKTSIELYEMAGNHHHQQQGKLLEGSEKSKELQRIKSFDYLSSTVASLSSSSQIIKTDKKINERKKQIDTNNNNTSKNISNNNTNPHDLSISINLNDNQNDNIGQLKLDSKRCYMSTQQLSFNFIRNKIDDTSLVVEDVQSMNFLTMSSQLLPSIQILPTTTTTIQTTRTKPILHYGNMNSPKSNLYHHHNNNNTNNLLNSNKQRTQHHNNPNNQTITNSNNKTFSGTTLTSSINIKSPTNKIITSAFKSPKVKYRYQNQKKQQTFNHLSQFDGIGSVGNCNNNKQRLTIKKIASNRVLTNVNKQ